MAKLKDNESLSLLFEERLPEKMRIFAKIQKAFTGPAEFYGFEWMSVPLFEDSRSFSVLAKNGLLDECAPAFVRFRSGEEYLLRLSLPLAILKRYDERKLYDLPQPMKFLAEGEVFFTLPRTDGVVERREWMIMMAGNEGQVAEAQIIQILWKGCEKLGVGERMKFRINAVGCAGCRSSFRSALVSYFRNRLSRFCKSCKKRFKYAPVKILSCEDERCRGVAEQAPQVLDFLCEMCKKHLRGILEFLEESEIPYFLDHTLFMNGGWYDTVVFEFRYEELLLDPTARPRRIVVAEGGRMMRAGELFCGKKIDSVSASVFFDRMEEVLVERGKASVPVKKIDVFFAHLGDAAKKKSLSLLEELRMGGVAVEESLSKDSIKTQLKLAERSGAKISLIFGQKEAIDATIIIREMESGIQETIPQEKFIEFLKRRLKR